MIAHVDMDAFYVSVELLRHPELRGKPLVVAHDGPRGVVTTASYEARKFGVHSALPMVIARRRCPELLVLPVDMQLYRRGSVKVMSTLREFSDIVEVVGMDEAYIDLSASPVPEARARGIKARIREETRLVCSIGLAPNKLMAKIASDLDKPDGFCVLDADGWLPRIGDKPAAILPGVGPKTNARLRAIGIETVAQLAGADPELLRGTFGANHGEGLRARANGAGSSDLTTDRVRKSESRETTFSADVTDRDELAATIERLADSVCKSLEAHGASGPDRDDEDPAAPVPHLHPLADAALPHPRSRGREGGRSRAAGALRPRRPGQADRRRRRGADDRRGWPGPGRPRRCRGRPGRSSHA